LSYPKSIDHKNSEMRPNASETLGELNISREIKSLVKALSDKNKNVREKAAETLGKLKDIRAVVPLIKSLSDENVFVKMASENSLKKIKDPRAVVPLSRALDDKDLYTRIVSANILGDLTDVRAVDPLIKALADDSTFVRIAATKSLGKLKDCRAVDPLIETLEDTNTNLREAAVESLGKLKDIRAVDPLIKALSDKSPNVRAAAAKYLAKDIRTVEPLIKALADKSFFVRASAVALLGELKDIRAVEQIVKLLKNKEIIKQLNDEDIDIVNICSISLNKILIDFVHNHSFYSIYLYFFKYGLHPDIVRIYYLISHSISSDNTSSNESMILNVRILISTVLMLLPQTLLFFFLIGSFPAYFILINLNKNYILNDFFYTYAIIVLSEICGTFLGSILIVIFKNELLLIPIKNDYSLEITFIISVGFYTVLFALPIIYSIIKENKKWRSICIETSKIMCKTCCSHLIYNRKELPLLVRWTNRTIATEKKILHGQMHEYFFCIKCGKHFVYTNLEQNFETNIDKIIGVIGKDIHNYEIEVNGDNRIIYLNMIQNKKLRMADIDMLEIYITNKSNLDYNEICMQITRRILTYSSRTKRQKEIPVRISRIAEKALLKDNTIKVLENYFKNIQYFVE